MHQKKVDPEESTYRYILLNFLDFKDDQSSKTIKSLIGEKKIRLASEFSTTTNNAR